MVRLTQRGAGKNCECGAPYFDEHEIASDARLTQFFPHQEIIPDRPSSEHCYEDGV